MQPPPPGRPTTVSLADEEGVRRILADAANEGAMSAAAGEAIAIVREHHAAWLAARPGQAAE